MNEAIFEESDFLLGGKVMRFLAERFTEKRKVTIRRNEIEKAIREKLTSKKVGLLTQTLKRFGIETTSKMTSSYDEELTFVVTGPDTEGLLKLRQRVRKRKTDTPIIVA